MTGSHTVQLLLKRGHTVRVFAHNEDDRSMRLKQLGAEVVIGDLLNLNDVRLALSGIRRAYFVYPLSPSLVQATAIFAQAAKEAEVEIVATCHSGTHARARRARQQSTTGSLSRFLTGRRCPWHISGRHSFANGCSGSLVQFARES